MKVNNHLREKFDIYDKTTTFMYRPPEMIDEYSIYIVNEKDDILALRLYFIYYFI